MSNQKLLEVAQNYIDFGFTIIPLKGKIPTQSNWQKTMWQPQLDESCKSCESLGFLVPDEIIVIDVDNHSEEKKGWFALENLSKDYDFDFVANAGVVVETANGGLHLYYKNPMKDVKIINNLPEEKYEGVEFKGKGRQVLIAESVLPNGKKYSFDVLSGDFSQLRDLPENLLLNLMRQKGNLKDEEIVGGFTDNTADVLRFQNYLSNQQMIRSGNRNNALYVMAAFAKNLGLSPKKMATSLLNWNNKNVFPPLEPSELGEIINNAYHYSASGAGVLSINSVFKDGEEVEPVVNLSAKEAKAQLAELEEFKDWKQSLIMSGGKISRANFGTRNTEIFLENLDQFRGKLALNQFTSDTVWRELPVWIKKVDIEARQMTPNEVAITDDDIIRIRDILNNHGFDPNGGQIIEAARNVSLKRPFHPVKELLESLPKWDGVARLERFFPDLCGAKDSVYTREVGKKVFVAVVSRIYKPGCKFDYLPIFVGEQGIGKSTLIKLMALKPAWFSDSLGDIENKDVILQMRSKLIIENGELTMFNKKEVTSQKAFLSRSTDRARLPYDRLPRDLPRQCIIISSTNESKFLFDETGNRRMWPIEMRSIKLEEVARQIPQLYAEALVLFAKGEEIFLDNEEAALEAETEQAARYKNDEWQEKIQEWMRASDLDFVRISDIWGKCFGFDIRYLDMKAQKRIGAILRVLKWTVSSRRIDGIPSHGYVRPIFNQ
jgi:predicted P-loop ATPase